MARKWRTGAKASRILILVALFILLLAPAGSHAATDPSSDPNVASDAPVLQPSGPLADVFAQAAADYGIPADILLAIGYEESHFEQQAAPPSGNDAEDGGYGVMHLVERADNDSLAQAAKLIGEQPDTLKTDAKANIRGAAALMQALMQQQSINLTAADGLEAWRPVVVAYSEAIHPGVADLYSRDIYTLLAKGVEQTTTSGESLTIPAHDLNVDSIAPDKAAPNSDDYGPAHWVAASSSNYTAANRPYDLNIDRIVIHDTEGSYASAISWFQNPSSQVSAHYVIRSSDGDVTQMVHNHDIAWHAGNWSYNQRAIGIEHEGYMNDPSWYTEAMYQSSAALVRNLTDRYGIPRDRLHIISHKEIPNQVHPHVDPGPNWQYTHYMALVRGDSEADTVVDNLDSPFHPVPTVIDPAHQWYSAGGSTYGSNAYFTYSVVDSSQSTNYAVWRPNIPAAGSYDIYAYIPYVSNGNTDTSNAVYTVGWSGGNSTLVNINQDAFTDGLAGWGLQDSMHGQWAALGRYSLDAGTANYVKLSDVTGENGKNVWFDAMRFIPVDPNGMPTATPTDMPMPTDTPTDTPQPTDTPVPTNTPIPTDTPTPAPTFTPGLCGINFPDLPESHWAYFYVTQLYCQNIISGYGDGYFHPNANMNRAQFAKLITLSMGWPLYTPSVATFPDVPTSHWAFSYVETANANSVLRGYPDGGFHPGYNVSRAQITAAVVRAHGWARLTPSNPSFTDVPPSYWAYAYVETAVSWRVISGYGDGRFGPDDPSTRAQLSRIIYKSMNPGTPPTP